MPKKQTLSTEPYEPHEDTMLLHKHIKEYAAGKDDVLEMGTGSGILAIEASRYAKQVVALDINPKAIELASKNAKDEYAKNIEFRLSNLFSSINQGEKFDLIIFNPPFLPNHPDDPDVALDGGRYGYELLGKFLNQVNPYLKKDGKILVVFSSFTRPEKVKEFIFNNCLEYKSLDKDHVAFEDLLVWEISKSDLLKILEDKGITRICFFAKGKRGYLYKGRYLKKNIIVKTTNPESKAIGRIENEINILRYIETNGIAPKVLFFKEDYFAYEYIKGEFIFEFVEKSEKEEIIKALKILFGQMRLLDKLGINKEEMQNPYKHIIISKKGKKSGNLEIKLVDFERARKTESPKNVTQFCQFLISSKFNELLKTKDIIIEQDKMIKLSQDYKNEMSDEKFEAILNVLR